MNASTDTESSNTTAREVPESERIQVLPRHFRRHMLTVEGAVYDFMHNLSADYGGGFWKYVELSNGGFYMRRSLRERCASGWMAMAMRAR